MSVPRRRGIVARFFGSRFVAVVAVVLAIIVIWYLGAFALNAPFQRDLDQRAGITRSPIEFIVAAYSQPKPTLPAPHQVAVDTYNSVVLASPFKPSSLIYHAWVTLTSTFVGFVSGTLFGILLAVGIVHVKSLDRSLMPWVISSQTIPILALAPILVVVAFNLLTGQMHLPTDFSRFIAKALISTYLSFFPVTVGMVKGLRSPDPTAPNRAKCSGSCAGRPRCPTSSCRRRSRWPRPWSAPSLRSCPPGPSPASVPSSWSGPTTASRSRCGRRWSSVPFSPRCWSPRSASPSAW